MNYRTRSIMSDFTSTKSYYWCKCGVCDKFPSINKPEDPSIEEKLIELEKRNKSIHEINFTQILKLLIGARVLIPETAIFSRGYPKSFIKFDSNKQLLKEIKDLKLIPVLTSIINEVKKRQKYMKINFTMAANIKYINKKDAKTFTTTELIKLLIIKNLKEEMMTVNTVQRYVIGGEVKINYIYFHYEKQETIKDREQMIMNTICEYIEKYLIENHYIELLYMKAIFIKDHIGKYWLIDATNIKICKAYDEINSKKAQDEFNLRMAKFRDKVLGELDAIEADEVRMKRVNKMNKLMYENYVKVRNLVGIIPALEIPCSKTVKNIRSRSVKHKNCRLLLKYPLFCDKAFQESTQRTTCRTTTTYRTKKQHNITTHIRLKDVFKQFNRRFNTIKD